MEKLIIFLAGLIILFLLGFGAPYAIGIISAIVLVMDYGISGFPFHTLSQKIINSGNSFTLIAIPFFLLAGSLMNTGGITHRVFNFCQTVVGWVPGGLGHANILASIVFAGMSGSAVADAAGLGTIEIKAMEDQGFDTEFSAAVTAASSTIGPIIPPSIPLIVYATTAGTVAVSKLLMAGIIPGLLMGITLSIMVAIISIRRNYPKSDFPSVKVLWHDFTHAILSLMTPVILIGGMLSGFFTPTEAAVVSVIYALILTVFIYREIKITDLWNIILGVAKESACVIFIICVSNLYGYLLTRARIPQMMVDLITGFTTNQVVILILLNLLFLVIGCFMDCNAAIMVMTPALMPLVQAVGINPIHFGIIMVLNLMIGLLTPPVGMCLYTVSRVAKLPLDRTIKAVAPFYIPLFITLMLVTFIPALSTFIPSLVL